MAEMALKERLYSAMGTEEMRVHTLLSPTAAAMNFAASFHRDAKACRTAREREQLHEIYRDKILAIDSLAANVAAAFLPLLHAVAGRKSADADRWGDFDRLAQRGKNMRDHESQHLQHQSGIIATWGLECFQYYGWHALPLPLLRQLHSLAVLMPRWEDVVDLLNSKMLARHELRVLRGKNNALRVGEHSASSKVQDARSPVERSDILAALEWARQKATSPAARQQVKDSARGINGTPIKHFGLKRDLYGMVVPSRASKDTNRDNDDDGDEDDDDANHVHDLEVSARPHKRTKLAATVPRRPMFPGLVGNYKAHETDARGSGFTPDVTSSNRKDNDQNRSSDRSESPHSHESEIGSESMLVQEEHTGDDDQVVGTADTEEMLLEEEHESDRGLQDAHADVETPRSSSISSGFTEAEEDEENGDVHDAQDVVSESENEADSSQESEDEEVEDAESKENERTTDAGEELDLNLGMISPQSQNLDVMEEERDESVVDSRRGDSPGEKTDVDRGRIIEAEAEEGAEEANEADGTEEQAHNSGDGESEDDDGREDLRTVAGILEGLMSTERTGTSVDRAAEPGPAKALNQTAHTAISSGSASRAPSPPSDLTATSSYQARKTESSARRPLSAVLGGGDNNNLTTLAGEPLRMNPSAPTETRSSVAGEGESSSQQPPTLLETLQLRYAAELHQLVQDLSRPHASLDVTHQRRLQLDWLAPQRWASIYAEPEQHVGRSSVTSPDDADVWYLSWEAFRQYADNGHIFRRPVVIKQKFQDSGMYNIAEYIDMLWQRFPEQQIEVQNSLTGACASMSLKDYCLTIIDIDLNSSDAAAAISSIINLRRLARADEPLLSRLTRFRLLSTLADRAAGTVGKSEQFVPSDVEGYLGSNLLGFAGAFSRSYVDSLVGSWVRCLAGHKIWAISTDLDADDWRRFSIEGSNWSPQGKGRLIVLEQDDVLFMPPGLRAIQAGFTPEPCLMEGGMLWDECTIPEILKGLLWMAENQAFTNESRVVQLSTLMDALEQWLDGGNHAFSPSQHATTDEHREAVKAGIGSLRALWPQLPL